MKEIEIFIRKLILKLYLFFRKEAEKKDLIRLDRNSRVLLVRLNKIGDALVTTPLIKLLAENLDCRIDVLADRKNHFIFRNLEYVNDVFVFPKKLSKITELVEEIESLHYDAVFDLHDDVSTTVTLFIGKLQNENKVSFDKDNRKIFHSLIPYPNAETNHVIERYLKFADFLALDYNKQNLRAYYPLPENITLGVSTQIDNMFEHKKFLVGINISAGSNARFWGSERYKELISYFENYDLNILLIAAEDDLPAAENLKTEGVEIFVNPDFNKFAAAVNKLDFLFTPDTSIVHLASAYNIPMFGIYVKYNTKNMIWYPYNTEYDSIVTEEPTFKNLEYETVHKKLKPFFEKIYHAT